MMLKNINVGDRVKLQSVGVESYIIGEVCKICEDKITISSNYFDDFSISMDIIIYLKKNINFIKKYRTYVLFYGKIF